MTAALDLESLIVHLSYAFSRSRSITVHTGCAQRPRPCVYLHRGGPKQFGTSTCIEHATGFIPSPLDLLAAVSLAIYSDILSMSLVLPWEVIERVIDHAYYDDYELLRSFSLTCRSLRPRALWVMLQCTHLQSVDQSLALCDFFRTKTGLQLQGHIQSLIVSPPDFPPFPLLKLLPNLSALLFVSR